MALSALTVKGANVQADDFIDLTDDPHRESRLEQVDMCTHVDECVHVYLKGWAHPVAIGRTMDVRVIRDTA